MNECERETRYTSKRMKRERSFEKSERKIRYMGKKKRTEKEVKERERNFICGRGNERRGK